MKVAYTRKSFSWGSTWAQRVELKMFASHRCDNFKTSENKVQKKSFGFIQNVVITVCPADWIKALFGSLYFYFVDVVGFLKFVQHSVISPQTNHNLWLARWLPSFFFCDSLAQHQRLMGNHFSFFCYFNEFCSYKSQWDFGWGFFHACISTLSILPFIYSGQQPHSIINWQLSSRCHTHDLTNCDM